MGTVCSLRVPYAVQRRYAGVRIRYLVPRTHCTFAWPILYICTLHWYIEYFDFISNLYLFPNRTYLMIIHPSTLVFPTVSACTCIRRRFIYRYLNPLVATPVDGRPATTSCPRGLDLAIHHGAHGTPPDRMLPIFFPFHLILRVHMIAQTTCFLFLILLLPSISHSCPELSPD